MAREWEKFGRAVLLSPSLDVFEAQLDKAPSSLSDHRVGTALSRRFDYGAPQVPSSLNNPMTFFKKLWQPVTIKIGIFDFSTHFN